MYAWIDIETTGLDEVHDIILEIGIKVTDDKLKPVHQGSWVVGIMEPVIEHTTAAVRDMHRTSGLWDDCLASLNDYRTVENDAIAFLKECEVAGLPMAGSSVHFDRSFLKEQMPELHDTFHYRNIDVSTVKNLARIHAPHVLEEWEEVAKAKPKAHRALDDLDLSIEELHFYLTSMKVGGQWSL